MVTVVSGKTLPLLSETVPVIPPRVCCARAVRDSSSTTASKKMPTLIFFAINVNLARVETLLQRILHDCLFKPFSDVIAEPPYFVLVPHCLAGKLCRQCTRSPAKAEGRDLVKILLAGISKSYGSESSAVSAKAVFLLRARTMNHPSPAIRYAR